jgi:hypothetical protein
MKRALFLTMAGLLLCAACGVAALAAPTPPKDDDKEGTIAGTPDPRPNGGWIGVEIKGGNFRLTFYNEKKKPVAADCSSAIFRWAVHYQPNDERTELLPTDDPSVFSSEYPVRAPYVFHKLHITLIFTGRSDVEAHNIDYPAP